MQSTCLVRASSVGTGGGVASGVTRPIRELVSELTPGEGEKAVITGNPHDGLGEAQGLKLGVGHHSPHIGGSLGQGIIGCAMNGDAMIVEVRVHRGLQVGGAVSTADFGFGVQNPSRTAIAVESPIE